MADLNIIPEPLYSDLHKPSVAVEQGQNGLAIAPAFSIGKNGFLLGVTAQFDSLLYRVAKPLHQQEDKPASVDKYGKMENIGYFSSPNGQKSEFYYSRLEKLPLGKNPFDSAVDFLGGYTGRFGRDKEKNSSYLAIGVEIGMNIYFAAPDPSAKNGVLFGLTLLGGMCIGVDTVDKGYGNIYGSSRLFLGGFY